MQHVYVKPEWDLDMVSLRKKYSKVKCWNFCYLLHLFFLNEGENFALPKTFCMFIKRVLLLKATNLIWLICFQYLRYNFADWLSIALWRCSYKSCSRRCIMQFKHLIHDLYQTMAYALTVFIILYVHKTEDC